MVKADALLDGPEMTIEFAKSKFLAIDDKSGSPSTVLKMKQKPSDISVHARHVMLSLGANPGDV